MPRIDNVRTYLNTNLKIPLKLTKQEVSDLRSGKYQCKQEVVIPSLPQDDGITPALKTNTNNNEQQVVVPPLPQDDGITPALKSNTNNNEQQVIVPPLPKIKTNITLLNFIALISYHQYNKHMCKTMC